jgi:RNA polymerase sigma-70 factor (ECF subfamily)
MSDADQLIVEDCKKGKRDAQNKLYKKFAPALLALCMRYARSREEAEDILQEGFIKVFLNIGNFRSEGSFEGWMKRIMINTAITHNKQTLKHQFHSDIDDIEETHLVEEIEQNEENKIKISTGKLMEMIQQLPAGYKMVFNLYVFDQYTHKEIAEMLGVSVNTSKSQLSKARRLLTSRIIKNTSNPKN